MIGVSLHSAIAAVPAAALEGAIVALPRQAALERVRRLRSPAWAAMLPGSIAIGTFGVLAAPSSAFVLVLVAAVTTPLLAALAIAFVTRARVLVLAVAIAAGLASVAAAGPVAHLGTSVVTALACLAVGATLAALIPARWLLIGVVTMAIVDAALLAAGFSYHQTALLAAASSAFHGPRFTGARVGATTIGYPDLFLAALVGSCLAGGRGQLRAAALVTVLAIACDSMLRRGVMLPATVPIALALAVVTWWRRRGRQRIKPCPPPRQQTSPCSSDSRRRSAATWSTSAAATGPSYAALSSSGHG
ncbi:MAG: hypothetical protein ACRDNJ_16765 [Solirubrobacteraceae bacterium]